MVKLTNNFHGTEITVRSADAAYMAIVTPAAERTTSERRLYRRLKNTLCGSESCTCGIVRPSRQIDPSADYARHVQPGDHI